MVAGNGIVITVGRKYPSIARPKSATVSARTLHHVAPFSEHARVQPACSDISTGLGWVIRSRSGRAIGQNRQDTLVHSHPSQGSVHVGSARCQHRLHVDISIFRSLFCFVLIVVSDMPMVIASLYMTCFYIEPIQKLRFLKKPIVISNISIYVGSL